MLSKQVAKAMKNAACKKADQYVSGYKPDRLADARRKAKEIADKYIEDPNAFCRMWDHQAPVITGVDYGREDRSVAWGIKTPDDIRSDIALAMHYAGVVVDSFTAGQVMRTALLTSPTPMIMSKEEFEKLKIDLPGPIEVGPKSKGPNRRARRDKKYGRR